MRSERRRELEEAIAQRFADNATHWADFDPFLVEGRDDEADASACHMLTICSQEAATAVLDILVRRGILPSE